MINDVFAKIQHETVCDWGVLMLGVSGLPGTPERLSAVEIAPFARNRLESMSISDPVLDIVVALSEEGIREPQTLREALATLCEVDRIDVERSSRIWRCWLLDACLADLDPDPTYGLLRLTGFWSAWGWPGDALSTMQRGANVPAGYYHSNSHYREVLREHTIWIKQEKACFAVREDLVR